MKEFNVTGMTCAACSARVEKAVSAVDGVDMVAVNLLTNSMVVDGKADASVVIGAVENAGYGAEEKSHDTKKEKDDVLKDEQTPLMLKRLISSVVLLIPLMYVSMGHMMWGWPLPSGLAENHVAVGLLQLLLTTAVMVINQKFFVSGVRSLLHRAPNMDTLVALGAGASCVCHGDDEAM